MHSKTISVVVVGSLISLAASLKASDLAAARQADNIRVAAPEASQFSPQNGYSGDLTLIGKVPVGSSRQKKPGITSEAQPKPDEAAPTLKASDDKWRFDHKLRPVPRLGSSLLESVTNTESGTIKFIPTPKPESK